MYQRINHLYKRAKDGDQLAKEEIIREFRPLVFTSIKRYYFNNREFEDLVQEGFEVILKCIEDFDENRGVKFPGYLQSMLRYHYLTKLKKRRDELSLDYPLGDGKDMTLVDTLEADIDIEEDCIRAEEEEKLLKGLKLLTHRQREVVLLYYIEGLDMYKIAGKLGISYRTVVNIKVQAINKLRKYYSK